MSWTEYFTKLKEAPPRPSLLRALELFDRDGFLPGQSLAIDLGCGAGQDSLALLARGWNVLSVDQERESMQISKNAFGKCLPLNSGIGMNFFAPHLKRSFFLRLILSMRVSVFRFVRKKLFPSSGREWFAQFVAADDSRGSFSDPKMIG